jgi:hypothetical protein
MNTQRKMYRIELREIDTIFTDMVLMAAASNGGNYTPLNKIADAADWICQKYQTTGQTHSVNRVGDNVLTIDKGTSNILVLTEVAILELDFPTLSRYNVNGEGEIKNISQQGEQC